MSVNVNSKSSRLKVLFDFFFNYSNYREIDIKEFNLSLICFVCVKETSQGDVSFTHSKHIFIDLDCHNIHLSLNPLSQI